jgi:endonuclease/exonuclease/phosphatase family metal-dependent hydrolase
VRYALFWMPALRLIAWNCHHGSLSTRLAELAPSAPSLVFLQECRTTEEVSSAGPFVTQGVNATKAIALGSLDRAYQVAKLRRRANCGRAVVGARVSGPVSFTALGIWSQGPRYVDDVMRTLEAYDRVLRSGPAVVMGDLNSGTNLSARQRPSKGHSRIIDALADLGLVSAYHAFHKVAHGQETHPTYLHQHNPSRPWHIDFCFVPLGWARRLVAVEVFDGNEWAGRSDHLPLQVDVNI